MRYEPLPYGRQTIFAMFGVFAVAAVVLIFVVLTGGEGPGVLFSLIWLAALAWNAYWWLFRFATEVTLDGDLLRWRAPLRRGELRLAELTRIRPMRWAPNVAVVEADGRRRVLVLATKGIAAFTEEVARRRPGLPVRLGWQARLAQRLPGRSGTDGP